jgi:hypothetical protein
VTEKEALNHKVDRTGWDPGPWDSEPDRVDFVSFGFACILQRNYMGGWCGYVGVPETHSAYGKHYDQVEVSVHGGLTYADKCNESICHIPKPGMPDNVWWLGFDCGHCYDILPYMHASAKMRAIGISRSLHEGDVYRDLAYVKKETKRLAKQLANV